ncbi:hypothetical protein [Ktedonospora formicarum]|uniref:Integral membrane protein n=1 Tax=Ktedonospora formicarum TaxID=2778364 RepID=A0A8J3MXP8_9CHLR|nr:hypothetical protein [Ktedonospora formicarum]GHO48815.1 hypothetical protein KSX_69780 [Ktedonospora formicarum]
MIMAPGLRKFALTAHVTCSIGWFGAVAAFQALAIAGLISQDREMVRATSLTMEVTTWFVIVPFAFASLLSGIVSSLGTKWGLIQYYWVLVKLLITIVATIILLVHTQPIDLLAEVAVKTTAFSADFRREQIQMVVASSAALIVLLVLTTLSVYKPRGMTRYGLHQLREQRQEVATVGAAMSKLHEIVQPPEGSKIQPTNFTEDDLVTPKEALQ